MFNKLKQVFSRVNPLIENSEFDLIINKAYDEWKSNPEGSSMYSLKVSDFAKQGKELLTLPEDKRVEFIVHSVKSVHNYHSGRSTYSSGDINYEKSEIREKLISHVLRNKLLLNDQRITDLIRVFTSYKKYDISDWPIASILNQIKKQFSQKELNKNSINTLKDLRQKLNNAQYEPQKISRAISSIEEILLQQASDQSALLPIKFKGIDGFQDFANKIINDFPDKDRESWYNILGIAQKATGSKPSKKFLKESLQLIKKLGPPKFKKIVGIWFDFIIKMQESGTEKTVTYGRETYIYADYLFLSTPNMDAIKGLVWMCSNFHDSITLQNLSDLAERCYRKLPGVGAPAVAIGNACVFSLFNSTGLEGVSHLTRLRMKVRQSNTLNLISGYLEKAAQEKGVSVNEIEELAVEELGMKDGMRSFEFKSFTANLKILGVGKSTIEWIKSDGSLQKSIPTEVKNKQKIQLDKLKAVKKRLDQSTTTQRDRLDRMLRSSLYIPYERFEKYYLNHGLISFLASKLIWLLKDESESEYLGMIKDGKWFDEKNLEIEFPSEITKVRLWHPVLSGVETIQNWRHYLVEQLIIQPVKQAYREIYILTDAEINTITYSNRMAAHILKQHQFNMLAKSRGWKYTLAGAFDGGFDNLASLELSEYNLRAEYWINEITVEDAMTDAGIWTYVATDQVRFLNEKNETVELINIPPILFSEVLRDTDLFVGVASIGNDPNWQDSGGLPSQYNDYWHHYSFGDLSEIAKERKQILEGLIPRLKIKGVASIKDKFLVVKGKIRTYKIHIGSTNILMEPNDQYLCIVPDRSKKNVTDNVFIPFEGDAGLSVILSKAIMLAEDIKIKDPSITSQIKG